MSLAEFLDAVKKAAEDAPGALEEIGQGASDLGKALSGKIEAPEFWIRLDAQHFPLSVTTDKRDDIPNEGERDVRYRPA